MRASADAGAAHPDRALAKEVGTYYADPYGFVLAFWPWGTPGPLANYDGPDVWQAGFLDRLGRAVSARGFNGRDAVLPVRMAVSSGHGVGKSALSAWLTLWIMATRPFARGVVTATTSTQLETRTWAAIQRWHKLSVLSHWFVINTERMYHPAHRESWFVTPQTCKEENSEAFAGQHAVDSTSFYIFDEASGVPNIIYEVAEGGLTDGEPMHFLFGNPTRSSGRFYESCFGHRRHRWDVEVVDARMSAFSNRMLIDEWVRDYGEDSDFVRVRVRGVAPKRSALQFIDSGRVLDARTREVEVLPDEPLVCGLDVARGGEDECVFWFRRGADARSIPPVRIPGELVRDSTLLVTKATMLLDERIGGRTIEMLFIDGAGVGGAAYDRLAQLGYDRRVTEVVFGSESPARRYANMRSFMWGQMRDWLLRGAIPDDTKLQTDLTGPQYHDNKRDRLVLEPKPAMKSRGLASPDSADALALTFAHPVVARLRREERKRRRARRSVLGGGATTERPAPGGESLGWMV